MSGKYTVIENNGYLSGANYSNQNNLLIRNIKVIGTLRFDSASNIKFEGVEVTGNVVADNSSDIIIEDLYVHDTAGTAIELSNCTDVDASEITITNVATSGTGSGGTMAGLILDTCTDVDFNKVVIDNSGADGIQIKDCVRTEVGKPTIKNSGVSLNGDFADNFDCAFRVLDSDDCTISRPKVHDNAQKGILVLRSDNFTVEAGFIYNNNRFSAANLPVTNGIEIRDSDYPMVINNRVRNNGWSGISIQECRMPTDIGNRCHDNGFYPNGTETNSTHGDGVGMSGCFMPLSAASCADGNWRNGVQMKSLTDQATNSIQGQIVAGRAYGSSKSRGGGLAIVDVTLDYGEGHQILGGAVRNCFKGFVASGPETTIVAGAAIDCETGYNLISNDPGVEVSYIQLSSPFAKDCDNYVISGFWSDSVVNGGWVVGNVFEKDGATITTYNITEELDMP